MSRGYCAKFVALILVSASALCALANAAWGGTDRFLVAEHPGHAEHHDSYVLPLSDPVAIAHARDLIQFGLSAGEPIVVAEIAAGANGINRDYLAAGSPAWSWHVTNFESFADFTAEILDGWPTFVESNVERWIANTGGYIGFWGYTVVAELPAGDYDADLDVDHHDHAAWTQSFGSVTDLSADGNGDGLVNAADYVVWRSNLASSNPLRPFTDQNIAVPEPATMAFSLLALPWMVRSPRRSREAGIVFV